MKSKWRMAGESGGVYCALWSIITHLLLCNNIIFVHVMYSALFDYSIVPYLCSFCVHYLCALSVCAGCVPYLCALSVCAGCVCWLVRHSVAWD